MPGAAELAGAPSRSRPDTPGVFVTSGTEDFLLHVAVADNAALYAFVIDQLTQRPEVADVRTSVVYEHLRNHRIAPAPPAGQPSRPAPQPHRRGAATGYACPVRLSGAVHQRPQ